MQSDSSSEVLVKSLKACKVAFLQAFWLSGVSNFLMLAAPIYSLQVLDRVISSGSTDTLLMLTLIVAFAVICLNLIQAIRSFGFIKLSAWMNEKLSPVLFEHSVAQSALNKNNVNNQNLSDLNTVKSFITGGAMNAILDAPWSVIFFIALFAMHHVIGFLALGGGVILLIIAIFNEK